MAKRKVTLGIIVLLMFIFSSTTANAVYFPGGTLIPNNASKMADGISTGKYVNACGSNVVMGNKTYNMESICDAAMKSWNDLTNANITKSSSAYTKIYMITVNEPNNLLGYAWVEWHKDGNKDGISDENLTKWKLNPQGQKTSGTLTASKYDFVIIKINMSHIHNDNKDQAMQKGIVMHEVGHALGLAHDESTSSVTIMNTTKLLNGTYKTIQSEDINKVNVLYPN